VRTRHGVGAPERGPTAEDLVKVVDAHVLELGEWPPADGGDEGGLVAADTELQFTPPGKRFAPACVLCLQLGPDTHPRIVCGKPSGPTLCGAGQGGGAVLGG